MKSGNWLILPIVDQDYPKYIKERAEKLRAEGVSIQQIAEKEGVKPHDIIQKVGFCRPMIEGIALIEQDTDNKKHSVAYTVDGMAYVISLTVEGLVRKIDGFLSIEPTYSQEGLTEIEIISKPDEDDDDD